MTFTTLALCMGKFTTYETVLIWKFSTVYFPMQRAKVVKVIIFSYGFCLERGLLLRIYRSVVNLLYLAFV
jgi:hypothetical protein